MSAHVAVWLLIPLCALVALIVGAVLITRQQRKSGPSVPGPAGQQVVKGFYQVAGETREDFVRRHRDRPGVIANGATLVDLYDRIRQLEERLAEVESERERRDQATP
ncbi:hypothetical protein [Promicromonospora soli]|uniref:Uncharacterized protein n=1 Tax=Promicromonospora soli TaxID=2035533 RepID=A0A919FXD2_9MICO|nr:hypothetical protein [Promicromonospora soli]GHH74135.1 hypothetical protein GCM10017772_27090 [Promicromonospora soli]